MNSNVPAQLKFHTRELLDVLRVVKFARKTMSLSGTVQSARGNEMNKPKQAQQQSEIDLPESELIELRAAIKAKIGQQLRSMYGEVVNEGVPDRFAYILRGLDDPADGGRNES